MDERALAVLVVLSDESGAPVYVGPLFPLWLRAARSGLEGRALQDGKTSEAWLRALLHSASGSGWV